MERNVTVTPKSRKPPPEGVTVHPPDNNHLSASDMKDDQRRRYRSRSYLASQLGLDPDKVEEARLTQRFK